MTSLNALVAGFGFVLALSGALGGVAAQAAGGCGGGWVRVGGGCALPEDLTVGDQVEVSIGSAVSQRGPIVGFADCGGQRTYYTSPQQSGCGWRDAITAYVRAAPSTTMQDQTTTALDALRWGGIR